MHFRQFPTILQFSQKGTILYYSSMRNTMVKSRRPYSQSFLIWDHAICMKSPRAIKNGPGSIISMYANLATSKNTQPSFRPNRAILIKWPRKHLTIVRAFSPIFAGYKIFAKVSNSFGKFDEKHDGEVTDPLKQTVFQLVQNFVQKWVPEHPIMVPAAAFKY